MSVMPVPRRHSRIAGDGSPQRPMAPRSGVAAIWLPWLAAPLFMLAPIGGCGLANSLRRPVAVAEAGARPPVVPVESVVTADAEPQRHFR
jgi:hypothetical protein